jgi:outer membrane lipoprotein-sorting protein
MKKRLLVAVIFGLIVLVGGCTGKTVSSTTSLGESTSTTLTASSSTTVAEVLTFSATLSGKNEVPAVTTSASGTLTLTVDSSDSSVAYVLTLKKLSNVTAARLHAGAAGTTGSTLLTLFSGPAKKGVFSGVLAQGSFTANDLGGTLKGKTVDDLVALIKSGKVYLNVGTSTHKSGAIRGQLRSTSTSTTSSTIAGSETTTSTVAAQGQTGGTQALTDLMSKYKQVQSVSLDFAVTTPENTSISGTMWSETGKMLKIQTTANGVQEVMLINLADNTMTMWQPATKQGTKIKAPTTFSDPSSYLNGIDVSKVQNLGTEDVNGETCDVVQYVTTAAGASTTTKMWLSQRLGFPVRLTMTTADGKTTTIDYTNIKVGSLPSGTFSVPADVKIVAGP